MIDPKNIGKDAHVITSLSSVLVSRLMLNLREQGEHFATATTTAATSSALMSTTLLHTLTNVEHVDEAAIHEHGVSNRQGGLFYDVTTGGHDERGRSDFILQTDIEMVQIADHSNREGHFGAQC